MNSTLQSKFLNGLCEFLTSLEDNISNAIGVSSQADGNYVHLLKYEELQVSLDFNKLTIVVREGNNRTFHRYSTDRNMFSKLHKWFINVFKPKYLQDISNDGIAAPATNEDVEVCGDGLTFTTDTWEDDESNKLSEEDMDDNVSDLDK